jgi:hypothetical protein
LGGGGGGKQRKGGHERGSVLVYYGNSTAWNAPASQPDRIERETQRTQQPYARDP